jgi:hypothetical protein
MWLDLWSRIYRDLDDDTDYFVLMEKHEKQGKLLAADFVQIGRWKENCLKDDNGRWKTGTPVAYDVWMQAKSELPSCPESNDVAAFLSNWSKRTFFAGRRNDKELRFTFGPPRATTVLHFTSRAKYPILDARVIRAMGLLGSPIENSIESYLNSFCPLFSRLAAVCGVSDVMGLRKLDNALFAYGMDLRLSNFKLGPCPGAQI